MPLIIYSCVFVYQLAKPKKQQKYNIIKCMSVCELTKSVESDRI